MSQTQDQIVETLSKLSIMDTIALTKRLETEWGVSACVPTVIAVPPPSTETVVQAQTEFDVILASVPADKKMACIKAVREVATLGLAEAKSFVESVPKTLREGVAKDEAEAMAAKLREAGGIVELK